MVEGGYIKLHRSMLDWEWYKDTNTKTLFLHCLLKANWKPGRFQGVDVPMGSFVTSYTSLSEETGLSERSIRTALTHLKATGELTVKRHPKFSVISIKNYCRYQSTDTQADTRATPERHSSDTQATTIEEYKNTRSEECKKESNSAPTSQAPESKPKSKKKKADVTAEELIPMVNEKNYSDELKEMLTTWLKYRVEIKDPVSSPIGFSRTLSRCDKAIAKHGEKALIDLIDLGISNNWHKIIFDKLEEGASNVQNDRGGTRADKKDQGTTEDKSELYGTYEWYQKRGLVPAKDEGTAGDSQYPFRV